MTDLDLLRSAAMVVLGERWQRPLAELLCRNDRTVRRVAAGQMPVPRYWLERMLDETSRLSTDAGTVATALAVRLGDGCP